MGKFAAATIASKSRLALARATAKSFCQHNPGIPFYMLLADEDQGYFNPATEPFSTIKLNELKIEEPAGFRFQYTEMELSYACTPYLIDYLLSKGFDGVIFLKQETMVLDSLAPEFNKLLNHSILLTPHFLEPPGGSRAFEWAINVLRAGVFNGGFLAFSRNEEARRVLSWWKRKTRSECILAVEEGVHYEQRWLDFVPSLAPGSHILRDPGLNVGHWNIPERRVRVSGGRITADGVPCRVFRFSGYQPENRAMVTKYNPHMTVESTGEAAEAFRRYQALLDTARYEETRQWPYAFGSYENGVPIPDAVRRIYLNLDTEAQQRFPDPFSTAHADSFVHWVENRQAMRATGGEL